ncbi:hypothetical protein R1flu_013797 [Riccia fluitans]|uniref:Uncharacterized protein n=1 Tax=Riccia fluitans TaxID=41844 RepID=A0ABD1YEA8_9MARC
MASIDPVYTSIVCNLHESRRAIKHFHPDRLIVVADAGESKVYMQREAQHIVLAGDASYRLKFQLLRQWLPMFVLVAAAGMRRREAHPSETGTVDVAFFGTVWYGIARLLGEEFCSVCGGGRKIRRRSCRIGDFVYFQFSTLNDSNEPTTSIHHLKRSNRPSSSSMN